MASTTLMTFRVHAPRSISNVQLLGSWDNFSKSYPMLRDPRTGPGHWRGCHSFTNIVCDGDSVSSDDGRNGGLMMGGTYWYYYQLNGDIEFHNSAEPSTTSCPFLPGQVVNVLEVPTQLHGCEIHSRCGSSSSNASIYYTLNPDDKYLDPRPSVSPKIRETKLRTLSMPFSGNPPGKNYLQTPALSYADYESQVKVTSLQPLSYVKDLSLGFIRRCSTSPLPSQQTSPWCPSFHPGHRRRSSDVAGTLAIRSKRLLSRSVCCRKLKNRPSRSDAAEMNQAKHEKERSRPYSVDVVTTAYEGIGLSATSTSTTSFQHVMDTFYRSPSNSDILASSGLQSNDTSTPRKPQFPESSVPQPIRPDESFLRVSMDSTESVDAARSILGLYADADMDPHQIGRHTTSVYSSTRTSALFSPSPTSSTFYSGYISPFHLEQPHTPVTIDFEECFLPLGQDSTPSQASNKEKRFDQQPLEAACLNPSGFDGYNLPDTEYASALTLRNTTSDDKKVASPVSAVGMRSSQDRVSSWNDGSAALEELFDELSYLGELII